jgi:FtsH-binding integral membrane protein
MSNFDRNYATATRVGAGRAAEIDAGLRAYMIRVYNYMAVGVALTGVAAWLAYQLAGGDAIVFAGGAARGITPFGQFVFSWPGQLVLGLGTIGLVFFISARINYLEQTTALGLFMLYAALVGVTLSVIFVAYTHASIVRVFFISAAAFGALSLYGYSTPRSLSAMGSFLIMGLFGIIIASIVNIFLASSQLQFVISVIGVLVFAGLTAWDTQRIKEMYDPSMDAGGNAAGRIAIMGALRLYLDFINLFIFLLQLLGDRRSN